MRPFIKAASKLVLWLKGRTKRVKPLLDLSQPGAIRRVNETYDSSVGADLLEKIGFRARQYLYDQPDLLAIDMDEEGASSHYLAHGLREHRLAPFTATLQDAQTALLHSRLPDQVKAALSFNLAESRMRERTPANVYPDSVGELLTPGLNYRSILVFGDSHIVFYTSFSFREAGPWLPVPFVCMGASARGLGKATSRLKYGAKIIELIEQNLSTIQTQRIPLLFHFGQNDVEFVYHFKRAAAGQVDMDRSEYETFVTEGVERYLAFLRRVRACVGEGVPLVVGVVLPPTLSDTNLFQNETTTGDVAWATDVEDFETLRLRLAKLVMPDWVERTRLHDVFNQVLRAGCRNAGFTMLDVFDMLLDRHGVVGQPFIRSHRGKDHHLDNDSFETQLVGRTASLMLKEAIEGSRMAAVGRSL